MTTFFLDLWHDLREKRLWPIAAGLAVAIVAVPIALTKSSSQPSTAVTPPAEQKAAHLPAVNLNQTSVASSHLDVFKERNPFKDFADKVAAPGTGVSGTAGAVPGTTSGTAGSSAGGSGSGSSGSSSSGSGGGSGSSSGGSSGGSSAPAGPNGKPVSPGTHYFVFTADVQFGPEGHVHTYKGIKQLSLLPLDSKSAVLSFYGVKDGAKAAVFFNFRGLAAAGEGKCSSSCLFVSLKPGQEETFAAGSKTAYTLKLLAVHTREVSKAEATGNASPDSGNAKAASNSKKAKDATLLNLPRVVFKL